MCIQSIAFAMLKDWDTSITMGDDVAVPVGLGKMKKS